MADSSWSSTFAAAFDFSRARASAEDFATWVFQSIGFLLLAVICAVFAGVGFLGRSYIWGCVFALLAFSFWNSIQKRQAKKCRSVIRKYNINSEAELQQTITRLQSTVEHTYGGDCCQRKTPSGPCTVDSSTKQACEEILSDLQTLRSCTPGVDYDVGRGCGFASQDKCVAEDALPWQERWKIALTSPWNWLSFLALLLGLWAIVKLAPSHAGIRQLIDAVGALRRGPGGDQAGWFQRQWFNLTASGTAFVELVKLLVVLAVQIVATPFVFARSVWRLSRGQDPDWRAIFDIWRRGTGPDSITRALISYWQGHLSIPTQIQQAHARFRAAQEAAELAEAEQWLRQTHPHAL